MATPIRRSAWLAVPVLLALAGGGLLAAHSQEGEAAPAPIPGLVHWASVTAPRAATTEATRARGAGLYQQRCALCHGHDGDGQGPAALFLPTAPRDFTRGVYKFRTVAQDGMPADLDLFRSITAGFPVYGMPSFAWLPEADRWALVDHLKSLYPRWEQLGAAEPVAIGAATPADAGSIERGRALYASKFECVQCHGPEGRGDGPRVPELVDYQKRKILPRDFTLGPAVRKAGWTTRDTVRILVTGVPGTPMPSQVDQLADPGDLSELWDVARYVDELIARAREK